jgi:hypothetical protein
MAALLIRILINASGFALKNSFDSRHFVVTPRMTQSFFYSTDLACNFSSEGAACLLGLHVQL